MKARLIVSAYRVLLRRQGRRPHLRCVARESAAIVPFRPAMLHATSVQHVAAVHDHRDLAGARGFEPALEILKEVISTARPSIRSLTSATVR